MEGGEPKQRKMLPRREVSVMTEKTLEVGGLPLNLRTALDLTMKNVTGAARRC